MNHGNPPLPTLLLATYLHPLLFHPLRKPHCLPQVQEWISARVPLHQHLQYLVRHQHHLHLVNGYSSCEYIKYTHNDTNINCDPNNSNLNHAPVLHPYPPSVTYDVANSDFRVIMIWSVSHLLKQTIVSTDHWHIFCLFPNSRTFIHWNSIIY